MAEITCYVYECKYNEDGYCTLRSVFVDSTGLCSSLVEMLYGE